MENLFLGFIYGVIYIVIVYLLLGLEILFVVSHLVKISIFLDILHLAWSPSDKWLASCSIDNTIVIWNAEKFPETTAVLKGHTSLVKVCDSKCDLLKFLFSVKKNETFIFQGVTWDPVGTYLASQSDDKSLKVWKTLDWKLETTITKPFREVRTLSNFGNI